MPVHVIIPIVEKDLPTLDLCIQGLRGNLLHPVKDYVLLGPASPEIIAKGKELDCTFLDERDVLPEGPDYYRKFYQGDNKKRVSWMYQQFLKLSIGDYLGIENYLTFDADTVLINPFKYELAGKRIFDVSDGYRMDLQRAMKGLFPNLIWSGFSFMCHIMLFQTSIVNQLLSEIETVTQEEWKAGIFKSVDLDEPVCFSEFELYANYCLKQAKNNYCLSYWFNKSLTFPPQESFAALSDRYRSRFRTLSFHAYNTKERKI